MAKSLTDVWNELTSVLRSEMDRAKFDTWVSSASVIAMENGTATIGVANDYTAQWWEGHLRSTVERALAGILGRPAKLVIRVREARGAPPRPMRQRADYLPPEEQENGSVSVSLATFDPSQKGFVQASNYALRFWQPYLRLLPFSLWLTLRSFAYFGRNEVKPSIQTIADICAGGNRHLILGRGAQRNRGERIGAIRVLELNGIIAVQITGAGHMANYQFMVLDNLPLLTPDQVATLPPSIQRAHMRFIKQCHIDIEEWGNVSINRFTRPATGWDAKDVSPN